jgi:LPXTG-motif cell wall-anchored protein
VIAKIRKAVALLGAAFALVIAAGGPALAASVTIGDFFFTPKTASITAGQSLTWTYVSGSSFHSVTADNGSFDSSPNCPADTSACIQPGQGYTHVFSVPGTFSYHCKVHSFMTGTVIVQAAVTPPSSGGGGGSSGSGGSVTPLPNTGSSPSTVPFIWLGLGLLVAGGATLFILHRGQA